MRTPYHFVRDTQGAVAVLFAVLIIPLMIAVGAAVDFSRANASRTALQAITDATALALTSPKYQADQVQSAAEQIIAAERQDKYGFLGDLVVKASLSPDGRSVSVQASTIVQNVFMARFGHDITAINAVAQAFRAVTGSVEVALVLDTTDSMNEAGKNKLSTLKTAATSMIDTLTSDPKADVKVAMVPFADYVNVGTAYRNASWISGANDYTQNWCTQDKCSTYKPVKRYYDCVTTKVTRYRDGIPYLADSTSCSGVEYGDPVTACTKGTCGTDTYTWNGCVGSRTPPWNLTDDNPHKPYPALILKNSSAICAKPIMPLSKDYAALKQAIKGLTAANDTYLPAGLVWGLNVLSPDQPFSEGAAYDPNGKSPRKVMVFMTDGINSKSLNGSWHTGTNRAAADDATKQLCANIKKKGIEIFSIALMVDDLDNKAMLQGCASGADHYFDATNSAGLVSAFSQIAVSLQTTFLGR